MHKKSNRLLGVLLTLALVLTLVLTLLPTVALAAETVVNGTINGAVMADGENVNVPYHDTLTKAMKTQAYVAELNSFGTSLTSG